MPAEQRLTEQHTGADFGTAVHQCWEEITWLHESSPAWLNTPSTDEQKVVSKALLQPEIKSLFTQNPGQEVYTEQSIEAITSNNEWLSASIDRLILTHDTEGRVIAAHIIDFKTNRPGPRDGFKSYDEWLLTHYAPQMREYGELIQSAFGLPSSSISLSLISCPKGHTARLLTYR
jgi:ATP-dependent exoDNAse (exonuclease V) beta subunit